MSIPRYLVGAAFVATGCYWFVWCVVQLIRGQLSMSWPKVAGEVSSCEIISRVAEGEGVAFEYAPRIRYSYVVHGTRFENTSGEYTILEEWGTRTWAEETMRRFDSDVVDVFVDPRDSSRSVLQRGISRSYYLMIVFCLVLVLIGLAMIGVWKIGG